MKTFGVFAVLLSFTSASLCADDLRARIARANDGDVLVVEAGEHQGPFVIDKSLRMLGEPGAQLVGDRKTHVVAIIGSRVEIAGFTLRHSGRDLSKDNAAIHVTGAEAYIHDNRIVDSLHGVYVRRASGVRILRNVILGDGAAENVADPLATPLRPGEAELCDVDSPQDRRGNGIHLWNSAGHVIEDNTITGTRDGIYFSFTDDTLVQRNRITKVRYGLHYMYSDANTFIDNIFSENAAGSALMNSNHIVVRGNRFVANRSHRAYGILLQSVDDTTLEGNVIAGNTMGLYLEGTNRVVVKENDLSMNYIGIRVSDSTADGAFSGNRFQGNIHSVETSGRNTASVWTVAGRGNRWDAALAIDLDLDGYADVPHREADLFGPWRRKFTVVGLLSASPGERLLRFIHGRIADDAVPGVTDHRPIVSAKAKP